MISDRPTVLITDDDRDLRETLGRVFERNGMRALLAANGDEAIDVVQHEEVHAVLMDLHMPRISGLSAVQKLREHGADMPCILITGTINEVVAAKAKAANVHRVIPKPLNFRDTIGAVLNALDASYSWQPTATCG